MGTYTATSTGQIVNGTNDDDTIYGGSRVSNVTLNGNGGADTIYGGSARGPAANGGEGDDIFYGDQSGLGKFMGDEGNDTFYGGGLSNKYLGGAGDDIFYAGSSQSGTFFDDSGVNIFYGAGSTFSNTFQSESADTKYYVGNGTTGLVIQDSGATGTVYFAHALSSYTLTADTTTRELEFSGSESVDTFNVETFAFSNGAGGYTTYTYDQLACFLAGTLIRTPEGGVAVEALQPGDLVMTTSGLAKPVLWVGRRAVETRLAHPLTDTPIRFKAHALGLNMPERDLYVSPDHALLVDGVLVQAGALVNGTTIARPRDLPETFTYYHVELENHDFLYAEGLPAETFLDNGQRAGFDNASEFPGRARPAEEMDLPRVKSRRQLPKWLASALARRLFGGKGDMEQAS